MNEDRLKDVEALKTLKKINQFKNLAGRKEYDTNHPQDFKVHFKIDNTMEHGSFKPSQVYPGQWLTTEQTLRALKRNIFALGDSIDEIAEPYQCLSCTKDLDRQFWIFCPYCGSPFKDETC